MPIFSEGTKMNTLQAVKNCRHFSSQILCVIAFAVLLTPLCGRIAADEERPGIGSNRSESLPHGARQSGTVGRNPSPNLQGASNERLVQAHSRMEGERAAQTQRIDAAYQQLQKARSQGGGGYDSPEQSRLIEEYNRAIRIRDARSAVSQELRSRQITPDGKWDMPHPTRNPPPRDVRYVPPVDSASRTPGPASRGSISNANSVALPGANSARGRSDTIAEGRASGNSSNGSSSGSSPRVPNTASTVENGTKPAARGDATLDTRNAQASQSESVRASRGPGLSDVEAAPRNSSVQGGQAAQLESAAAARAGQSNTPNGGTFGRASSPAPADVEVSLGSLRQTTRDAQGRVVGAVPTIVITDVGARIINRGEDIAEGREVSSTGEFVAETAGGLAVGAAVGTAVGMAGTAVGAVIGGTIGFVLGGGPPGAIAGVVTGAELGGGATVGAMTAIGAIRSGESFANALDRYFFNGDSPIQNQDELLRTGLGDSPHTNQVASGPLTGTAPGDLAAGVQSTELDQVQAQLLNQFPELANASPAEQREIAMQVLGLNDRERGEVMAPDTSDVVEGPPVEVEVPLHPPIEIGAPGEAANGDREPMPGVVSNEGEDELDSLLDGITGPREEFEGSALQDFLDQMGADVTTVDPNAVISQLEREFDDHEDQTLHDLLGDFGTSDEMSEAGPVLPAGAGDEGDFADPSVSSIVPYEPPNVGGDIDLSIFRSAQEREDMRNLFRTDGDYDEAMRLEGDLQRAEAAYRRAIAEARRLAAARRAAEAAERQRQAQIAYNNWVRQHQAWQRWMAQQKAYRNWVAQQQNVSHYVAPQRSAGHQSGGLIMDPAQ